MFDIGRSIRLNVDKNNTDVFLVGDRIGKGATSQVYKINNEKGDVYALKVIDKDDLQTERSLKRLQQELRVNNKLKHPNVLRYIQNTENEQYIFIMLELCGSDLYNIVSNYLKGCQEIYDNLVEENTEEKYQIASILPYTDLKIYAKEILLGIQYMHSLNIGHFDIKPQNIMICNGSAKLSDFGLARSIVVSVNYHSGTINYIAPEMLEKDNQVKREPDIWSYGATLYYCAVGRAPFEETGFNAKQVKENISLIKYSFPSETSFIQLPGELKEVIASCLQKQELRPSATELLNHTFYK